MGAMPIGRIGRSWMNMPPFKRSTEKHTSPSWVEAFRADSVKFPKICTEEEKEQILRSKFYDWAIAVEKEKLYYFYLVFQQRTLAIEAPSDNNRQKDFLGYEWSNRKGQEGIKIRTPGGALYNSSDRFARGTLACAIRDSFSNAITEDLPIREKLCPKGYARFPRTQLQQGN